MTCWHYPIANIILIHHPDITVAVALDKGISTSFSYTITRDKNLKKKSGSGESGYHIHHNHQSPLLAPQCQSQQKRIHHERPIENRHGQYWPESARGVSIFIKPY